MKYYRHDSQPASDVDIQIVKTSPDCQPMKTWPPGEYTYWIRDLPGGVNIAVLRCHKTTRKIEIDVNNAPK